MPKTHEMRESKYLKKEDVGRGLLVTITGCEKVNVEPDEKKIPDYKWALNFQEVDKPLILNSTNIQLCEQICGSDDTDDWNGKQIVLYTDPNISYGGKLVGGVRVRKPLKVPVPKHTPKPLPDGPQPLVVDAPPPLPPMNKPIQADPGSNPFDPTADDDPLPF